MSFVASIIGTAERVPLPDLVVRAAIARLCSRTAARLAAGNAESDAGFATDMAATRRTPKGMTIGVPRKFYVDDLEFDVPATSRHTRQVEPRGSASGARDGARRH